ncbi:ABC transporter ATP-binding protein [Candidatus Competibacter denitrificans Run_A_D11]|uniref:ABC transporter ATP-binding protein n=1 Tax=Candidatus Competibacter denitrificans Run_A_D11 TaxID=1400863 RepID=W6M067_9GAMM|nr:polysaccharide ABC transporter ATP-binding protein [Candidatus Competibacter denitrificans]CDI00812.1 ABC transporter ATP-binding protein [Candidatus Competibacter denitrificans Run_A_D11]
MSDIVIKAEGLGKKYLIGHEAERERYVALRDVMVRNVRDYWSKSKALFRGEPIVYGDEQEEVWVLRDVSFEIQRGESVGIIGSNGAGKSTLLKIMSRITEPSAGRLSIRGRVASLLEVGTGFHPELTGRENIYLNGAILGMLRQEIKRKFDEIVDFAEVERFLDTPVKRYSSGMYVRLAFAVAAHLEPEILVVDEVLAVGDAAFQKKCFGKMQDVSRLGRTIILVSHNMSAIRNMTKTAILLNNGEVICVNDSVSVAEKYLRMSRHFFLEANLKNLRRPHIKHAGIYLWNNVKVDSIDSCQDAFLLFRICTLNENRLSFGFTIFNSEDVGIFSGVTTDSREFIPQDSKELKIKIPSQFLNPGEYRIEGALSQDQQIIEQNECYFTFLVYRDNRFDIAVGKSKGLFRLSGGWEFN